MATPSEQFESGKNPKPDAVQVLRNQLDQLEKRGGGDSRVVEAVRNTRSRLDTLQKSLNNVHELERTALKMQAELNQTTEENATLKESLPADVVKKLENAARVEVSSLKPGVAQSKVTINTTPVQKKTPDTAIRVKPGAVLTLDGQAYTMPVDGTVYARRNFSAVRQGNEWVVTKRTINAKPSTVASVVQPKVTINTAPSASTPVRTVEKTPDTRIRVKLGGVLKIEGKDYTFPPDGTVYARRNFMAVRQGNEWMVTMRTIIAKPLTQNRIEQAPIPKQTPPPAETIKVAPPPPTALPTPKNAPANKESELTPVPARNVPPKSTGPVAETAKPVPARSRKVPKIIDRVPTPVTHIPEQQTSVVPLASEMEEAINVPEYLKERFAKVDSAYRTVYNRLTNPKFKLEGEQYLSQVEEPDRSRMEAVIRDGKQRLVNETLIQWKNARNSFASAPSTGKAVADTPPVNMPPELIDLWAAKYKNAPSDKERAKMFIEDAALQPFPLLTPKQLEAAIVTKVFLNDYLGPDGIPLTKDDLKPSAKRIERFKSEPSFLPQTTAYIHNFDPIGDHFEESIQNLDGRSANAPNPSKQLGEKLGKVITVEPANGINKNMLAWMLNAQNSPIPKTGIPAGMEVSFTDAPTIDSSIQLASASKLSSAPAELKSWTPSVEKSRSWQEHARALVSEDSTLKKSYESHKKPEVRALYQKFRETVGQCWKVYTETVNKKPVDELLVQTTLQEIERTMYYYGIEFANAAKGVSGSSNGVALDDIADSADGKMARMLFYRGQTPEQINTTLTTVAQLKPFRTLTDEQVYSLLYLKAHLPALAGSDGKLNRNDIDALVDGISKDVLAHPDELYKQIIACEKIDVTTPEGKEKATGLAYALGIPERTKGEYDRIKTGLSYLNSNWSWTVKTADQEKLKKLTGLVEKDIRPGVKKDVTAEIVDFMESAGLSLSTGKDSGHGTITQSDMKALEKHARVLKSIGGNSLQPVMDATGAKIETSSPNGLSTETVAWMLDGHARPQGRVGMPPGTVLRIDQKTMPSFTPTPSIAAEPDKVVPAKQETVQKSRVESVSKGAKGVIVPPPPAEDKPSPLETTTVEEPAKKPSQVHASVEPEKKAEIAKDILVDKQAREIRLPSKDTFRVDYNPNPSNIPATTFSPDKTAFFDGIAMNVRRDANNWIVTVKPGFENAVSITRERDNSTVKLSGEVVVNVPVAVAPEKIASLPEKGIHTIHSKAEFENLLKSTKKPILVKFEATWCMPCKNKELRKAVDKVAKNYAVYKIDVDAGDNQEIVRKYNIPTIPHFMGASNEKNIKQLGGVIPTEADLLSLLQNNSIASNN